MAAPPGARSPSSSPRLPSPPPIAEDQTAPRSPMSPPLEMGTFNIQTSSEHGASRRIRPGTKAIDMNEGPPLVELQDIDSAFQLTEHLKALHHNYTHPPDESTTQPITRSTASLLASVPPSTDRSLWLYELCRFLVQQINVIITSLFTDTPSCSASTCPEMRASEWQYLCAVHDPPKSCCAIDYCCHTLDWAANTLTNPKYFPSRLALNADDAVPHAAGAVTRQHQERQLTNVFRRVYRIFAHAWFQHREVFWRVEGRTGLYVMFKTVCDVYTLIPEDNYTIPPEAEGLASSEEGTEKGGDEESTKAPGAILKREEPGQGRTDAGAATARRHRSAPSKSGSSVSTVVEENEDDESNTTKDKDQVPPVLLHHADVSPGEALGETSPGGGLSPASAAGKGLPHGSAEEARTGGGEPARPSLVSHSPTSPLAMKPQDLMGLGALDESKAEEAEEDGTKDKVAQAEDAAKSALSRAKGSQAGTADAANETAATKTVED